MKRLYVYAILAALVGQLFLPLQTARAAGMSVSGGGNKTVGQSWSMRVTASGAEFDALQGVISVSGPVTVVSIVGGGATWLPGKAPSNGGQFVGITSPTSNLTVATVNLRATKEGKGSVSVSNVQLARNGSYVGSSGGSASFTIGRAPTPPGGVEVSSPTHPDQAAAYEATTIELAWKAPANGASGYSTTFDQAAETVPAQTVTTRETSAKYENVAVGTHYFHIRAQNADGWSGTTHFKITIKEPDPKVNEELTAPAITAINKAGNFVNDVEKGTVSGIVISGTGGLADYTVNIHLQPQERLPKELFEPQAPAASAEDKEATTTPPTDQQSATPTATPLTPLQAKPDPAGNWQVQINYPVPAGFYTVSAQSQKDKVLSPLSAQARMELAVAQGGTVKMITDADVNPPQPEDVKVLGVRFEDKTELWLTVALILSLLFLGGSWLAYFLVRRKRLSRA